MQVLTKHNQFFWMDFEVVSPPLSPRYILIYSVCYCYTLSAHTYYSIQLSAVGQPQGCILKHVTTAALVA